MSGRDAEDPAGGSDRVDAFADLFAAPSSETGPADETAALDPTTRAADETDGAPEPAPGGRVGPYLVRGRIGRGGMGVVLRVEHAETGGAYALKLLRAPRSDDDRRELARFQREIELLARADAHPAIVRIHASGETDGRPWYAMELVAGSSLSTRLAAGPLPPRQAAALVAELARAVEHLHGLGILHRDLKPANVLVEPDGRPRLVDLGIAFETGAVRLTHTGEVIGTPTSMAPEQVQGPARKEPAVLGPTVDVYGLGAILLETLTGRPPFAGLPTHAVLAALLRGDAPERARARAPAVPDALDAICARALRPSPAERYPSAKALADDLERWLQGESIAALPAASPRRARRALRVAVGAGMLMAVIALIGVIALPGGPNTLEATARWNALADAALEGDLDALGQAVALGARAGAQDDPERSRRARLLAALARLLERGDVAALEAPALRADRGAVRRFLVGAGRADILARLAEREPRGLRSESLSAESLLLDAVEAGTLAPRPALADALIWSLETTRAGASEGRQELLGRALSVELRLAIAAEPPDLAELDEAIARLVVFHRATGEAVALPAELVTRFLEIVGRALIDGAELDPASAYELGLALRPDGQPQTTELTEDVLQALSSLIIAGRLSPEPENAERGLAAAIALHRAGAWPMLAYHIGDFGSTEESLRPLIREDLTSAGPDGRLDLHRLGCHVATLVRVAELRIRRDGMAEEAGARSLAILEDRALLGAAFDALIDAREDVPGWLVAWLAALVDEREAVPGLPLPSETDREAALVVGDALARIIDRPSLTGVDLAIAAADAAVVRDRRERTRQFETTYHASLVLERVVARGRDPTILERAIALHTESLELITARRVRFEIASSGPGGVGTHWRLASHVVRLVSRLCRPEFEHPEPCPHEERIDRLLAALRSALPMSHHFERGTALHLWRHGAIDDGLAVLAEGVGRHPGDEFPLRTYVEGAENALGLGRHADARRLLEATADADPEDDRAAAARRAELLELLERGR